MKEVLANCVIFLLAGYESSTSVTAFERMRVSRYFSKFRVGLLHVRIGDEHDRAEEIAAGDRRQLF